MGFFRGGFLAFTCFLLLISFFIMNSFSTLSSSLEYGNVQNEISPLASELANNSGSILGFDTEGFNIGQATNNAKTTMERYCQNNIEYTFVFEGRTISVPCSSLNGGTESVVNETMKDFVHDIYYKEYDCNFLNCFTKEKIPFFLISQKAKDYWHQKFYFALLISIILAGLLFLLVENKLNWPILVGSILILASIPLIKIGGLISLLIPEKLHIISLFLNIFFSKAITVFLVSSIIGLVLVGLGIGLRFSNSELVKKIFEKDEKKPQPEKVEGTVKKEAVKKIGKKK